MAETIDDPFGIPMVVPAAGVLVPFGFRLFLGSRLPSTVIVMDAGRIIADGPKDAILEALKQGKIKAPTS